MRNSVACANVMLVCFLSFTPPVGFTQQAGNAAAQWPEVPTVQDWLAQELREMRMPARAPVDRAQSQAKARGQSSGSAAIQLLAIYGSDGRWAAHVRIGGHTHMLRPAAPGTADDARGKDSIVADSFEGRCLRLRYRATSRRLCLPTLASGPEAL